MNSPRPQKDDDSAFHSWRQWPTGMEWTIIGFCIAWPLGLHLILHFGRSHQLNELLVQAISPVCLSLILVSRSWQVGRFWLLALIFGGGITPTVYDSRALQYEKRLIFVSVVGLIVGLVWNDVVRLFREAMSAVKTAEPGAPGRTSCQNSPPADL